MLELPCGTTTDSPIVRVPLQEQYESRFNAKTAREIMSTFSFDEIQTVLLDYPEYGPFDKVAGFSVQPHQPK